MNKKERRRYRKSARDFLARAQEIELPMPDIAASLKRVAAVFARLGLPTGSKKRKFPSKQD